MSKNQASPTVSYCKPLSSLGHNMTVIKLPLDISAENSTKKLDLRNSTSFSELFTVSTQKYLEPVKRI